MPELEDHSSVALLKTGLLELGYKAEHFAIGDKLFTRFNPPNGLSWLTADDAVHYPFLNYTARVIAKSKEMSNVMAESLGVTIPKTFPVSDPNIPDDAAEKMLQYAPLVVKPNDSSLARGVHLNVRSKEELLAAARDAFQYSDAVLCQQEMFGEEYRIAVIDGVAQAVLLRQSPFVVGDGTHTVLQLIEAENEVRRSLKITYNNYPLLEEGVIELSTLPLDRILNDGERLQLKKTAMIRYGASVYNVTAEVHPSYLRTAEKLANALGNGLVAVDMFITDHTKPQTSDNYGFIEFNMSPILDLFYSTRDGNDYPILDKLVPLIDKNLKARK